MRRIGFTLLFLAFTLFSASTALAQAAKADPLRARLESMGKAFSDAYNSGDDKKVASFYAEDAVVLPPDSDLVRGRAAIEEFWAGAHKAGIKNMRLEVLDAESSGNYAVETGKATADVQPEGQAAATTETFKYVVVWKKQKGGEWKIIRDIWNGMAPPAPAPAMAREPAMAPAPAMATKPAMMPTPAMATTPMPKAPPKTPYR
ncbi:MAG TPA: DUF4440 domain-containing protein [Thermoanaerobaculia bacterium]|jgi:uncharacterized protein (TIGR02246 family)|nr:DUF4440 domain-containing protein [Thermoanaerobaculia bacterium]